MTPSHVALIPVKPPARGKSRLGEDLAPEARSTLARAFALDTVEACLASARIGAVLVVTDDAVFSSELIRLGSAAIPDGVSGDLNGSLLQAVAEAHRRWSDLVPVAICADLPALRPADLDAALDATAPDSSWFVADAAGTGTTLYTAPAAAFEPRFGAYSAAAHAAAGATPIRGDLPSLRHDVDTLTDLQDLRPFGLGPRTTLATINLRL